MTLTSPPSAPDLTEHRPLGEVVVTAVLVAQYDGPVLDRTLTALVRSTSRPLRLAVIDVSPDGRVEDQVGRHDVAGLVDSWLTLRVPVTTPPRSAVLAALDRLDALDRPGGRVGTGTGGDRELVWFLTTDSVPEPGTLAELVDAVRVSPSVGAAGPKLLDWYDRGALQTVGISVTRSGRLVPSPAVGEPDQGQYDMRSDVLAVPFAGQLVDRELLDRLGGYAAGFRGLAADLDLGWRAQLAGRRVVVVPTATMRIGAVPPDGTPDTFDSRTTPRLRREVHRVALARCSWLTAPFLAVWIAVTRIVSALGLVLAKRPVEAWQSLADIAAVLDPWRPVAARWRTRGTKSVSRGGLSMLFVDEDVSRQLLRDRERRLVEQDRPHHRVGVHPGRVPVGPTHPGVVVAVLAAVVSVVGGRLVGGGLFERLGHGVVGGELVGTSAEASTLWHAAVDTWTGSGLGAAGSGGPHLAVLAVLAWLAEHVPFVGPAAAPAGAAVGMLLAVAMPLAAASCYLSARVLTRAQWPRAVAAAGWAMGPVALAAVGGGRVGAVVALLLLPPVAAGLTVMSRRESPPATTSATILAVAVLGVFAPPLLVGIAVYGLGLVVAGRGRARRRGLALAVVPALLLGPWLVQFVDEPVRLLAGPGLSQWGEPAAWAPWIVASAVPALLLALVASARRSVSTRVVAALTAVAVVGVVLGLVAPRVHLGVVPAGLADAGAPVTMWPGLGLLVTSLAVVAAVVIALDGLPLRRRRPSRAAVIRFAVGLLAVAAVVAPAGTAAWTGFGTDLRTWGDTRPPVAVDQANGPLANRTLVIDRTGTDITHRLIGREDPTVVRTLPVAVTLSDTLTTAVSQLVRGDSAVSDTDPAAVLADHGIGFVSIPADFSAEVTRGLDTLAGLTRLPDLDGASIWRVMPLGSTGTPPVAVSRWRLERGAGGATQVSIVPTTGENGASLADVTATAPARLVIAAPRAWASRAVVSVDGEVVAAAAGGEHPAYPVPAGEHSVEVTVGPEHPWWLWAQAALIVVLGYLAIPFGRSGRSS